MLLLSLIASALLARMASATCWAEYTYCLHSLRGQDYQDALESVTDLSPNLLHTINGNSLFYCMPRPIDGTRPYLVFQGQCQGRCQSKRLRDDVCLPDIGLNEDEDFFEELRSRMDSELEERRWRP